MQKRTKLTNTTVWTFLGIGERTTTTKVASAVIVNSQYTRGKGGRLRAALAWSIVLSRETDDDLNVQRALLCFPGTLFE